MLARSENLTELLWEKPKLLDVIHRREVRKPKMNEEDESGTKRYVTEIVADDCEFLTPKAKNSAPDADVEPGYDEDDEP